jgi:anti-sigma factor RsiW
MPNPASEFASCKDLFAALSQYLDKDLTVEECAAVEAHIAGCPPCVAFVNSLKKTVALCNAAGTAPELPPLPEDVRQQLLEAYRRSLEGQKPGG